MHSMKKFIPASQNWNPIDTAPKDGTEILAWRSDAGVMLVKWCCAEELMTEQEIRLSGYSDDCLQENHWFWAYFLEVGGILDQGEEPTHWMPLPNGPYDADSD